MTVIHEYESVDLDISREQAESLLRTGAVDVRPAPGGGWRLTAGSLVGSVVVEGIELFIRPKIRAENLFLLLEPGLPQSAWRAAAINYDSSSDLVPAVVAFFAHTLETTLGRGILRSYQQRQESLVALRGRMDVASQFRRAGVLTPVACTFDEFTEDILENRVLKAAVRLALRVPGVAPAEWRRLMRQLSNLEAVSDLPVRPEEVERIHFTRLNEHYAPVLRLAALILANLTLKDSSGATSSATFLVDMNDLFQRFVHERLRRALRGVVEVEAEPKVYLGTGRQIPMKPDLVFRGVDGAVRHVGDVKYKLLRDARGYSSDYYQLLAYTTALGVPAGILIYCRDRDRDGVEHRSVTVENAGKSLYVRTVDLSGSSHAVDHEISALAMAIRELVAKSL